MAWPCGVSARAGSMSSRSPRAIRICQWTRSRLGDHLGHRMLDLQARVHLEEVERPVVVEQELDRAGVGVADGGRDRGRGVGHPRARSAASTNIDGDSSTTFWWRRWIEHSRSTNGITVPW